MLPALLACVLSAAPVSLAVLDLGAHEGVSADLARSLSELLVVEVRDAAPAVRVFGSADVTSLIHFQDQRTKLGERCQDSTCLAQIGGAVRAQELVSGSLSILGGDYLLVLRRLDVAHAKVLAETSGSAPRTDSERLRALVRSCARGLFVPGEAARESAGARRARIWPWVLGGTAVVALGACVIGWAEVGSFASLRSQSQTGSVTYAQAQAAQPGAEAGQAVGIVGAIAAVALGTGAALTW